MKRTMGLVIKQLREENRITQAELAKILKVSPSTIGMWENNERSPNEDKKEAIADFFNVDMNYLYGKTLIRNSYREIDNNIEIYDNLYKIDKRKIPLIGTVACGEPIYADEHFESYVMAGADIQADFCLRCKGNSMINARIHDGDIVFVRKQNIVNNGEIAVVIIDDEATLKRFYYYKEANFLLLKAENPDFPDLEYHDNDLNLVRVIGKAIAFQGDIK